MLRASAGDDDRVRNEIPASIDEIAADRRHAIERSTGRRHVARRRLAGAEVVEKLRKCLLAGAEKDGVGVRRRFFGQRRDVQPAEHDERAASPVVVGDRVGAARVGDVDLNDDEVGTIVELQPRHVLVFDHGFVVRPQVGRQRRQPERRKQRVFDRAPVRAGGFGQRREDEFDAERSHGRIDFSQS